MDTQSNDLEFSPKFEELTEQLDHLIEHIVESCKEIKRIEEHLFQSQEDFEIQYIGVMQADEQPVAEAKSKIEKVVRKNTSGPERLVFLRRGQLLSFDCI